MYDLKFVDIPETIKRFGYDPSIQKMRYYNKIVARCSNCNGLREIQVNHVSANCNICAGKTRHRTLKKNPENNHRLMPSGRISWDNRKDKILEKYICYCHYPECKVQINPAFTYCDEHEKKVKQWGRGRDMK